MSYFKEIAESATYSGEQADFHFNYNANSGGGQAFLGGKYYDAKGELVSPETLNGKTSVFKFKYTDLEGEEIEVVLDDQKAKYDIKPRGNGSTSMKLGIGNDRIAPSRVIAAFMMLPQTCGVKTPSNLDVSMLSSQNYWLQSMWLKCNIDVARPDEAQLIPVDLVFGGGTSKDTSERQGRYFSLDVNKRMLDVIRLSKTENLFQTEVLQILQLFADVYQGNKVFQYDECSNAVIELMKQLAVKYPDNYSGIMDALPFMIDMELSQEKTEESILALSFARNRILFGAPGTGKSFTLVLEKEKLLSNGGDFERVTFHPDYSYANFVGTYKPVMHKKGRSELIDLEKKDILLILQDKNKSAQKKYDLLYDRFKGEGLTRLPILLGLYTDENFKTKKLDGTDAAGDNSVERNHGKAIRPYVNLISDSEPASEIAYEYVPGPFMRILVKALKSAMSGSPEPYLLIIEEINRVNVAAVFGDVFQLLDRDGSNESEYEITTTNDMRSYLAQELEVDESEVETIKIPDNMFIWATMNSADQGVFPMDTAFKRRWSFTYLGINDSEADMNEEIKTKTYTFGVGDYARVLTWNQIRRAINDELSSETYNINEDKLLGPYFISKSTLLGSESDFMAVFKNKVLMYLFDDAVKQKRKTFFENCRDVSKGIRYSEICAAFDERGVFIFPDSVSKEFSVRPPVAETEAKTE